MRYLLLFPGAFPGLALALSESDPAEVLDPMSSVYLIKLTLGLVIVVVSIFAIAWGFKRLNLSSHSANSQLQIIATLALGTRDRIVVLEVGDEQLLLGVSPGKIEKLHLLSKPLEISQGEAVSASFAQKLNQLMKQDKSA